MVGTTIGLLIASGIAAGGSVAAAKMGANASRDATKTATEGNTRAAEIEAQSNREALDFTKGAYEREQQQLAPYVGAGGASITELSRLLGLQMPTQSQTQTANPNIPKGPWTPTPQQQGPTQTVPAGPGAPGSAGMFVGGAGRPDATFGGTAPAGTATILMQAPTGETAQVPTDRVAQAIAKGARIAGGPANSPLLGSRGAM